MRLSELLGGRAVADVTLVLMSREQVLAFPFFSAALGIGLHTLLTILKRARRAAHAGLDGWAWRMQGRFQRVRKTLTQVC